MIKSRLMLVAFIILTVTLGKAFSAEEPLEPNAKLYVLHFQKGVELTDKGEYELARSRFLMTLYLNPDHAGANYQLGLMAYNDNNNSAAISFLERASHGMPNSIEPIFGKYRKPCYD